MLRDWQIGRLEIHLEDAATRLISRRDPESVTLHELVRLAPPNSSRHARNISGFLNGSVPEEYFACLNELFLSQHEGFREESCDRLKHGLNSAVKESERKKLREKCSSIVAAVLFFLP